MGKHKVLTAFIYSGVYLYPFPCFFFPLLLSLTHTVLVLPVLECRYFASVGIHYPRFTPGQWDDLFVKAKADGYNMVQTYFFHNAHQPKLSTWPWIQEGPSDLRQFLEKAGKAGFFVDLRIGQCFSPFSNTILFRCTSSLSFDMLTGLVPIAMLTSLASRSIRLR